jgi:transposase-like protein
MLGSMYVLRQVPSEAQIRKTVRKIVFGAKLHCPVCMSRNVIRMQERYRCRGCRTKFSLLSHTWLSDLKLPVQTFWLLCWCWVEAIPVQQAQKLCRLSEDVVRRWYERFRVHLPDYEVLLRENVQMDEAYFRGWVLVMAKDTERRTLAHTLIPAASVQRQHAVAFLEQYVAPDTRLHTDGAGIYRGIEHWWPVRHTVDIHRKWEFGKTSEIEGTFGNLRTFIRRMYHHVTPAKLPSVVTEFSLRFCRPELFESPDTYLEKSLHLDTSWPN